jgi:hypothetical protein
MLQKKIQNNDFFLKLLKTSLQLALDIKEYMTIFSRENGCKTD